MYDYYPFGLTFNSYQRENSVDQRYKFQGQEHINDLDLGWDSFKWRNHQPEIGRFFGIDPLAETYVYNSPYAFSENKVVAHIELEGLESWYAADGNLVGAGPLTNEEALSRGAVEYGVLSNETVTETVTRNTFTNQEIDDFVMWNQTADLKGACIAYATRGAEMLTGESAGWDTKNGNLNVIDKHVWDLGETMQSKGAAVQININPNNAGEAIVNNSANVGPGENSAFIVGPAGASHALITTFSGDTQQMSLIDQGSGWNRPSVNSEEYSEQIRKINYKQTWSETKAWRLQIRETVTRRIEIRTPIK